MNRQFLRILVAALIVIGAWTIAPVSFTSCQYFPSTSQQTSDQIILRAEQTAQVARATFNTFIHLDRDNEALLKKLDPAIHDYANTIREHGLDWVDSLRAATRSFEANRTSDNQANLNTWLTTVNNALTQVNGYVQQSKAALPQ